MRLGTATALVAMVGALAVVATVTTAVPGVPVVRSVSVPAAATGTPTATVEATRSPAATTWSADLAAGEAAGVALVAGTARLDPAKAFVAPAEVPPAGASAEATATAGTPVPTGLLTLPTKRLAAATDRVDTAVLGDVPAGSTASVDVRGRNAVGRWSEWIPTADAGTGAGRVATLPEPAAEVQGRLVLTGPATGAATGATTESAGPAVRGVTLTAQPTSKKAVARTEQTPLRYKVFATREGLVGRTTANGHKITKRDRFVALPSRRALSPRGTNDYSVKVCATGGRCAFAPVWDVGPWNTRDDYWNASAQRQQWRDLPRGLPEAQAAKEKGYNGGKDQYGRKVANPAGIDLADGLFWDALKLTNNSFVTVDYLWTGSAKLAKVASEAEVRGAPDASAQVVGVAAPDAAVPVECALGSGADRWLRIGVAQYLLASLVPDAGPIAACSSDTTAGDTKAGDTKAGDTTAADAKATDTKDKRKDDDEDDDDEGDDGDD